MLDIAVGTAVTIIEDCRNRPDPGVAGQVATYEGMHDYAWKEKDGSIHTMSNPRLRLADGSVIWGIECWWAVSSEVTSMEEEKEKVLLHKTAYHAMRILQALNKLLRKKGAREGD